MRALIIHAGYNTTKPDATGAFIPEARSYREMLLSLGHEVASSVLDNRAPKPTRRRQVEGHISTGKALGGWDHVAFFGHGLSRSLQTGHDLTTVGALADALTGSVGASRRLVVTLYACDAGDSPRTGPGGDGGFADALRDALAARGVTGYVDAHTTTGHTTRNPHVRRFSMDGGPGVGGEWLVEPGSPLWRKWVAALKGPMRFRFPLLTREQIRAELGG